MNGWNFLTNHTQALLYIASEPDARLRSIAVALDITERTAYGIVADLADVGYIIKQKDGRCNRYQVQMHMPLHDLSTPQRTIGELVGLLVDIDN